MLAWVCKKRGVYFGQVDYRYTSQICPNCGSHTGKKDLSERIHRCPECHYEINRDVAAAKVICHRGVTAAECRSWFNKLTLVGVLSGVGDNLDKCHLSCHPKS
ncbi:transposase [Okeania sp. KiyG1]|uniref:transposase n=1 Tax=Okeania sp. KiyG1 TaxID=2720165 RepID=UPI0027DA21D5|nr:transposase [Okeania sp. KiyG1]